MNFAVTNGPPTPEELQRELQAFMKQHFAGGAPPFFNRAAPATPPSQPATTDEKEFQFSHKPKDVKAHLDRFVIKQEEAKKVLSVALCDHYHHVRMASMGQDQPNYAKQNIILVGPTGVGKTYLVRSMAELIGVPFVKADATKFSETGYVGGDVEDLVRDLVRQAGGDVRRAQYGIIYLDEIDKISTASHITGRDVSGRGVQTNLLKLMEETEVPARAPNDIAGQIQAMMEMSQQGKKQPSTINTRHILFIVSGAFDGLEKLVSKRLRESMIGFAARGPAQDRDEEVIRQAQTRDFIDYGFEPEFIGRLPVRVFCHALNTDDLYQILAHSEGSIVRQYEQSFGAYGLKAAFKEDGMRRLAEMAAGEQTGARGLMTVCERVFREFKFELPSTLVSQFEVSRELVEQPAAALKKLLEQNLGEGEPIARQGIAGFTEQFQKEHNLKVAFTEAAVSRLVQLARERGVRAAELCARLFKDYQFGLRLIAQNTGQQEFSLDVPAVEAPDKFLSDWVVASYSSRMTTG